MLRTTAIRSLAALAAMLCVPVILVPGPISTASAADMAAVCASPRQMEGFRTCADVAKAEQEGALVLYSPDPEEGSAKLLAAFHNEFPKITTNFIRLQTGALYQKLMTERRANVFMVDVLQLTDIGFVLDFQKRNGYLRYVSPEMSGYKADYKSTPEGYWTWASFIMAGIAYNPKLVPPDQVPKSWKDMLNSRWAGVVTRLARRAARASGPPPAEWASASQLEDITMRAAAASCGLSLVASMNFRPECDQQQACTIFGPPTPS